MQSGLIESEHQQFFQFTRMFYTGNSLINFLQITLPAYDVCKGLVSLL
jgi:hypothetical protein